MASELTVAVIAILAGVLGGIASPILGWLATTDPFNSRKFIGALITGTLSGLGFSVIALANPPADSILSLAVFGITTLLSAVAIDYIRNKTSAMTKNPTPQPPPG